MDKETKQEFKKAYSRIKNLEKTQSKIINLFARLVDAVGK